MDTAETLGSKESGKNFTFGLRFFGVRGLAKLLTICLFVFWILISKWVSVLCHVDFDSVNPTANINLELHIYEFHLNVIGTLCSLMARCNACLFLRDGGWNL